MFTMGTLERSLKHGTKFPPGAGAFGTFLFAGPGLGRAVLFGSPAGGPSIKVMVVPGALERAVGPRCPTLKNLAAISWAVWAPIFAIRPDSSLSSMTAQPPSLTITLQLLIAVVSPYYTPTLISGWFGGHTEWILLLVRVVAWHSGLGNSRESHLCRSYRRRSRDVHPIDREGLGEQHTRFCRSSS
jgi:hypothetical protein